MSQNLADIGILMISLDKTLVGATGLGDAAERHKKYGAAVRNLDIIVYTNKKDKLARQELSSKVRVYPSCSLNKFCFWFDVIKIAKEIRQRHKFDLVVCQDPFVAGLAGWCLKKKFGAKLLLHFHGDFWQNKHWLRERWLNKIFLIISRFVVPRADGIRVMSRGQKDKLISAGIAEKNIEVIATPVDIDRFQNYENLAPEHKQHIDSLTNMQPGRKMILMVSRKDKVKDFDTLFKAIKLVYEKYRNIGLWLVGSYAPAEIKDLPLPRELKDSGGVFISGNINSADLPAYYKTAYLTVLSSTSESFGKVLVEANACAKAVVATATTGAKEIIRDGYNGFLVPIKDYRALADRILYLLKNPDKAKEMGNNGQNLVRTMFSDNTSKVLSFWQRIVNSNL